MILTVVKAIYATAYTEAWKSQDFNPVEVLTFSGFHIRSCINCVHNCEDHSLLDWLTVLGKLPKIKILRETKYHPQALPITFVDNSHRKVANIVRQVWNISFFAKLIVKKSTTTLSLQNMFRSIIDHRQLQVVYDLSLIHIWRCRRS